MTSHLARGGRGHQGLDQSYGARIWGARGSVACGGAHFNQYGGDTMCVELFNGSTTLVFDAGTGIRELGNRLIEESKALNQPVDIDLVLTHTHYDHVVGLPFFVPLFIPSSKIRVWLGREAGGLSARDTLAHLFKPPLFPLSLDQLSATISFHDFTPGDDISLPNGHTLATQSLNHPDGATGYRMRCGEKDLCFITDVEHVPGRLDEDLARFVQGADVMFYDATYTDAEYPRFAGWGHSTWEEGLRLTDAASVDRFVAVHHDPSHDDQVLARIEQDMVAVNPRATVARQGTVIKV